MFDDCMNLTCPDGMNLPGATPRDELAMRALLDDLALVEHDDPVRRPDCAQAMRDHELGSALADLPHVVLDDPFGLVVESPGGLVEDQHARGIELYIRMSGGSSRLIYVKDVGYSIHKLLKLFDGSQNRRRS
jgi:hypothetical protein